MPKLKIFTIHSQWIDNVEPHKMQSIETVKLQNFSMKFDLVHRASFFNNILCISSLLKLLTLLCFSCAIHCSVVAVTHSTFTHMHTHTHAQVHWIWLTLYSLHDLTGKEYSSKNIWCTIIMTNSALTKIMYHHCH